jgi:hypothetical protein
MRKIFTCLAIVLGLAAPAHAQNDHSFVSGTGSGTGCTFVLPCNNLRDAITATLTGGIITCVDQGANADNNQFFATGTISKSITIDCAGTSAVAYNIIINGPGIVVVLRNLNINSVGLSGGSNGAGIDFQNGAALFVENCTIDSWNTGIGAGIHFAPTSGTAKLHVTDSVIRNNGVAAGGAGIFVAPTGGASTRVAIERTVVENNTYGIVVVGSGGTTLVEVKDSMIANNAINGIWAFSGGATTSIVVDHSASNYNGGSGVAASGNGGFVSLSDTTVAGNTTGLSTDTGGSIGSYGNNRINGNVSAGVTPTSVALK